MNVVPVLRNFATLPNIAAIFGSNLKLWLRPLVATMWEDSPGTDPVDTNLDVCQRWDDQSGENDDQVAWGGGCIYNENVQNGLPMLSVAGGLGSNGTVANYFDGEDTPFAVFVVLKQTSNAGEQCAVGVGQSFSFTDYVSVGTNSTSYRVAKEASSGGQVNADGGTADTTDVQVLAVRHNGTTVDTWLDGTQIMTAAAQNTPSINPGLFALFASPRSFYTTVFAGYIGEVAVINIAPTDGQMAAGSTYLINEWAIS